MQHKTKIIATVGPACNTYDKLLALIKEGVNVFRLNFSHGTHEQHKQVMDHVKAINQKFTYNIALLADLQGPKLRVGEIKDNALDLKAGDEFYFTNEKCIGTLDGIYISYPNFASDVRMGEKILLDDGKIEVLVKEVGTDSRVKVEVLTAGIYHLKKA